MIQPGLVTLAVSILTVQQPAGPGARYVQPLVGCAGQDGYAVEFVTLPVAVHVVANAARATISVNERLDAAGQVGALLYQIAYFHRPDGFTPLDQEIWAESVAYRVRLRLGLPTDESDRFLKLFPQARFIAATERNRIDAESASIQACILMGPIKPK